MISQEKLRKYVDIIEKYDMKSRVCIIEHNNRVIEIVMYIEKEIKVANNSYFLVYGAYNSDVCLKLFPSLNSDTEWLTINEALKCSEALKNCALMCKEINNLRIPFNAYESIEFIELLRKEYLRRGKRLNIDKSNM